MTGALALAALGLGPLAAPAEAVRLTPESPASPGAEDAELAYVVMLVIAILLVIAINGALIVAVRRFGAGRDSAPRRVRAGRGVVARATIAFTALAAAVFTFGVVTNESATDPPDAAAGAEPLEILVSGQQWLWRFEYPDEAETFSYHEMVVPVDTPVRLRIVSTDVLHRWWVPALGGAADATPGTDNVVWFEADETGVFEGRSTEYSGPAFAQMQARVRVVESGDYERWLSAQAREIKQAQDAVSAAVAAGEEAGVQ